MSIFKKTINDSSKEIGTHIGDTISQNARNSTNEAFIGMDAFIKAYNDDKIQNNKKESVEVIPLLILVIEVLFIVWIQLKV